MRIRIHTDFDTNADTDKRIRMRDVEPVKHGRRKSRSLFRKYVILLVSYFEALLHFSIYFFV